MDTRELFKAPGQTDEVVIPVATPQGSAEFDFGIGEDTRSSKAEPLPVKTVEHPIGSAALNFSMPYPEVEISRPTRPASHKPFSHA